MTDQKIYELMAKKPDMKINYFHVTSPTDAMAAETGDRRFTSFTGDLNATEVAERLAWPNGAPVYCDTWLMVNAADLSFTASQQFPVSAMANIGHQLLQEIAAYRPAFQWADSPAEIVGALIEETITTAQAQEPAALSSAAIWFEMVIIYGVAIAILMWNWC